MLLEVFPFVFICMEIVLGVVFLMMPAKMLELQIAICRHIHWNVVSRSEELEIRDLRIIGIILIVVGLTACLCIINMSSMINGMIANV